MNPENLEVYCKNIECGDTEVHPGGFHPPVASRRYRRMNYMGTTKLGALKREFFQALLGDKVRMPPSGEYHLYQCPVCGTERAYVKRGDMLMEVE